MIFMDEIFDITTKAKVREVARKHRLTLVIAFGSAAAGRLHERSDIDFAIRAEDGPIDFQRLIDISADMQEIFPERVVDLVPLHVADPLLLKKISETAVLLCGDLTDFNEFKIYAYKRYIDHKPYFEMERRFAREYPKRFRGRAAG